MTHNLLFRFLYNASSQVGEMGNKFNVESFSFHSQIITWAFTFIIESIHHGIHSIQQNLKPTKFSTFTHNGHHVHE